MSLSIPESERVGAASITLIIVGIVITVPAFLVGSQVMRSLGLIEGSLTIIIGCSIIAALSALCMNLASKHHISTYQLSQGSFGIYGSKIVSFVIGFTLIGWFAMTANLFGEAAIGIAKYIGWELSSELLIFFGSSAVIITVIYGFKSLERLSRMATPFLALMLLMGIALVVRQFGFTKLLEARPAHLAGMSNAGAAISVIIGALMVAVSISPDLAQFARTQKDGVKAAWLGYGLGGSFVLIGAGLPGLAQGSDDLIGSFAATGLGFTAYILLLIATWTTNAGNLFSARLASGHIFQSVKPVVLTILLGTIGTFAALWLKLDDFGRFLQILAISIPPIAGIYLCDGYILKQNFNLHSTKKLDLGAFLAWGGGTGVAMLATYGPLQWLYIPALASLVTAFLLRWIISILRTNKGLS